MGGSRELLTEAKDSLSFSANDRMIPEPPVAVPSRTLSGLQQRDSPRLVGTAMAFEAGTNYPPPLAAGIRQAPVEGRCRTTVQNIEVKGWGTPPSTGRRSPGMVIPSQHLPHIIRA
jgi:hypothetical protein